MVQAARQCWKKIKEVTKDMDYFPSKADPCLFIKDKSNVKSFIIIYVDDRAIFSTAQNIKDVLAKLGQHFVVKPLGNLEHFVGCHIIESTDTIWIHQPKLIKHLDESFSKFLPNKSYKTPAAPKSSIERSKELEGLLPKTEQTKYRSGLGMLLYLVKHSRPDIANAVRELSKVADIANQAHWKALMRLIKYVLGTRKFGLKLNPNKWDFFL